METAIAAQNPKLKVLAAVREWNLKNLEDKLCSPRNATLPSTRRFMNASRSTAPVGVSLYVSDLADAWQSPSAEAYVLTKSPEEMPNEPIELVLGFTAWGALSLNGQPMELLPLVRELNRLGGEHGIGRSDVGGSPVGIKSREFYERRRRRFCGRPSRFAKRVAEPRDDSDGEHLGRRYAELVYMGLWVHRRRLRRSRGSSTKRKNALRARCMKLYKGACSVQGRRSPESLYDSRLANQSNLELFDNQWAQGFTSLWTLPTRGAWKPAQDGGVVMLRLLLSAGRVGVGGMSQLITPYHSQPSPVPGEGESGRRKIPAKTHLYNPSPVDQDIQCTVEIRSRRTCPPVVL